MKLYKVRFCRRLVIEASSSDEAKNILVDEIRGIVGRNEESWYIDIEEVH